jgi:hypothetical protein
MDDIGLKMGFDEVLGDSRCPMVSDIVCFWQGMAGIRIWVEKPGQDRVYFDLAIEGLVQYPHSDNIPPIDTLGFSFDLVSLDPYEGRREPPPLNEYVATIRVETEFSRNDPDGRLRFSDQPPTDIMMDEFDLNSAGISDDNLNLSISYGGGCRRHYFFLYMSPPTFMESEPVQVNMYVRHLANNDACEAYITRDLVFDLTPLSDLYKDSYGSSGDIIINIYDYYSDTPGEKLTVSYSVD